MTTQQYLEENRDRFLEELKALIRIPSISTAPEHKQDTHHCAVQVQEYLVRAGLDRAKLYPTAGHPIVYGEKHLSDDLPTVLIYGHYDVQPADPLDEWDTPPFEPTIRKTEHHPDGAIFARGATDDKGQMFIHVKAVEAMIQTGNLPCNVKFMIEGEEEIGSPNLIPFITEHKEMLSSDVILISDTSLLSKDHPSITVGLRGLTYLDVKVRSARADMHSGLFGGAVANPINVLCDMIASLKDENKHITIPGFYDDVQFPSERDRQLMRDAPFDAQEYMDSPGVFGLEGEKGYTTYERTGILPTLDVNGIWGGFTGEGSKTVIPAVANAKISMRLVSNQDHEKITQLFSDHFKSIAPETVKVEVKPHHGGNPYVTPTDTAEYRAAADAVKKTFGREPVPMYEGGSIPIVAKFKEVLGVESILMGFGFDTDGLHSPNEHFGLWNFYKGIETVPEFFQAYSRMKDGV
ncbi:acetylornithine deacetylase/succinyl-diaminopimelate desuccinylase-like protein [Lewinella marina]|uniref:Peptidase dimerization domain protein n=1 Tax=Neolewinella marina TaxID=438751 RepID=A0A2G0CJX7_9BACT|nr:dipeptidase [Neolewinella marina]NJB84540.1 acetylornithine deacetylase/succinyl-diaminopimelate desuccinylase-like protein [Neolewinella marina]PHL00277.1 peptidase dimerization domain protein [Neolewinella marina]